MIKIDIEKIKNIKEELASIEDEDIAFISEGEEDKYAILPMSLYEQIEDIITMSKELKASPQVKIVNANSLELSYDEYESVKKQIMEAFDKTFKPKPEKLN